MSNAGAQQRVVAQVLQEAICVSPLTATASSQQSPSMWHAADLCVGRVVGNSRAELCAGGNARYG